MIGLSSLLKKEEDKIVWAVCSLNSTRQTDKQETGKKKRGKKFGGGNVLPERRGQEGGQSEGNPADTRQSKKRLTRMLIGSKNCCKYPTSIQIIPPRPFLILKGSTIFKHIRHKSSLRYHTPLPTVAAMFCFFAQPFVDCYCTTVSTHQKQFFLISSLDSFYDSVSQQNLSPDLISCCYLFFFFAKHCFLTVLFN